MRLSIRHRTLYEYEPEALRLALRLRLWPSRFDTQSRHGWTVTVNGQPVEPLLTDDFGDEIGLWHAHHTVEKVEVIAQGEVETQDAAGVVRGLGRARAAGIFLRDTKLTAPDDAIRALAHEAAEGRDGPLAALHALKDAVCEAVDYRPGVTDETTTAARALALGAGVCQDQAHVFIAGARSLGIPARYVSGYLFVLPDDAKDEQDLRETHGWAEAHVEGLGWVGFDATNGVCPTDGYVRLTAGLDANEASPMRGSVTGQAEATLEADVAIAPAGQSQTQSQSGQSQSQSQ